jgi:Na+(H+)/acetate symporter ActP
VGSLIAIGGVMVQFWIVMGGVETPSWAVALGTPVLVFAALGWVFRFIGKRAWAKFNGREVEDTESEDDSGPEEDEKNGSDHWVSRAQVFLHIKPPALADS